MISFVIVNYNMLAMVKVAIQSLMDSFEINDSEIILIDNASTDGSKEYFESINIPNFQYIYNTKNLGFGKANNLAVDYSSGEIFVFINPDIIVDEKGIDSFVFKKLKNRLDIIAPRIIYPNGKYQPNCGSYATFLTVFFHNLRVGYLVRKLNLVDVLRPVFNFIPIVKNSVVAKYLNNSSMCNSRGDGLCDWVSGACLAIHKDLFVSLGGFDDKYFMYYEDEDLCRRANLAGGQVKFSSDFTITHYEGFEKLRKIRILPKSLKARIYSSIIYISKFYGKWWGLGMMLFYVFLFLISSLFYFITLRPIVAINRINFLAKLIKTFLLR